MKLNVSLATVFFVGLLSVACKGGTDPLKEVKTALNNKRPADAMKLIQKMAADTAYAPDAQYYELGAAAAKKLNDAENEKLYLRRNPDTAAYFSTQYEVFAYALRADSAQRARLTDKNASTRVSGSYAALLARLYPNLATASRYFLTKEKWNEAARFAKMTLEVRNAPIFGPRALQISPALEMQNAEDYLYAGYASGRFDEATRYIDAALRDSLHRSTVLRTLALNYEAAQKQDEFLALLKRGVREEPNDDFFFGKLAEEFFRRGNERELLAWVDSLLPLRTKKAALYDAQAEAYDRLHNDSLCLRAAQQLRQAEPDNPRADYFMGKAYVQMAKSILLPTSIKAPGYNKAFKAQRKCYEEARPHLERFRKAAPDAPRLWAPLLYDVYLKLNLGKEFEEISKYNPA